MKIHGAADENPMLLMMIIHDDDDDDDDDENPLRWHAFTLNSFRETHIFAALMTLMRTYICSYEKVVYFW